MLRGVCFFQPPPPNSSARLLGKGCGAFAFPRNCHAQQLQDLCRGIQDICSLCLEPEWRRKQGLSLPLQEQASGHEGLQWEPQQELAKGPYCKEDRVLSPPVFRAGFPNDVTTACAMCPTAGWNRSGVFLLTKILGTPSCSQPQARFRATGLLPAPRPDSTHFLGGWARVDSHQLPVSQLKSM